MNQREKCLCFLTALILIIDIVMALCLFTILPEYLCNRHYVAYGSGDEEEDKIRCKCIYLRYEEGANVTVVEKDVPEENTDKNDTNVDKGARRKRDYKDFVIREQFPYLVSMQIPAYNDVLLNDMIFAGIGTILNEKYFLTASKYVREPSEWRQVLVRAGTVYWSEFGHMHSVRNYFESPDYKIMLIEVDKPFQFSSIIKPVKYPHRTSWKHANSIDWPVDMYSEDINKRFKHKAFLISNWTTLSCVPPHRSQICFDLDDEKCDAVSGLPLVSHCGEFIALKMTGGSCDEFMNVKKRTLKTFLSKYLNKQSARYSEEIRTEEKHCQEIYEENCLITSRDVCV